MASCPVSLTTHRTYATQGHVLLQKTKHDEIETWLSKYNDFDFGRFWQKITISDFDFKIVTALISEINNMDCTRTWNHYWCCRNPICIGDDWHDEATTYSFTAAASEAHRDIVSSQGHTCPDPYRWEDNTGEMILLCSWDYCLSNFFYSKHFTFWNFL